MKIGSNEYDKIEDLLMIQADIATEIMGKINLNPIFSLIQASMGGHEDVVAQIFGNGFLGKAITELLTLNGDDHILVEVASLMVFKKGDYPTPETDYDEYREDIKKDLLWSKHEITIDLVSFFLEKSGMLQKISGMFSQELPKATGKK